jgi:hypothetical protein
LIRNCLQYLTPSQEKYNYLMRLNIARGLIGLTILWNLQAALAFLLWTERYINAFELEGMVGAAMLRGLGVLFVMWNIPYLVALWHPIQHRISLYEALAMQSIGLLGEVLIYLTLPATHDVLNASILRFIAFDAAGLLLLLIAVGITRKD